MRSQDSPPRWVSEFERLCQTKKQILLYGNVRDLVYLPIPGAEGEQWTAFTLELALMRILSQRIGGYGVVGHYDVVDGMVYADEMLGDVFAAEAGKDSPAPRTMADLFAESVKGAGDSRRTGSGRPCPVQQKDPLNSAIDQMRSALRCSDPATQHSSALIIDYGTQLVAGPEQLAAPERHAFLQLLKSSQESEMVGFGPNARQNLLIVICDALNDLPMWTYMNNPFSASIDIAEPSKNERQNFFTRMTPALDAEEAAALTDGMGVRDLMCISSLAEDAVESTDPEDPAQGGGTDSRVDADREAALLAERMTLPKKIVDRYKYGDRASMWSEIEWGDLADAEDRLKERVFGQPAAIHHVADVLRRARLHLSGAQHSGRGKPRGVLFFAGPTGVGKTELAKAVTELLFGDEEHYQRFDMSEYGQPHSDARLIGAPPGYVGYDAGGQLTNRVRDEPFSVLLFDEIEKADPSILDKFLQILEDGRMTDGRGRTVYFSECLLIFTSNAGLYETDDQGRSKLRIENPEKVLYPEVRREIMEGLDTFFVQTLKRPELQSRFGENIVVFDFVREEYLSKVLGKAIDGVVDRVKERWGIEVIVDDVVDQIKRLSNVNVSEGARGVGNKVEQRLLNPLGRWLFDHIPSRLGSEPLPADGPDEPGSDSGSGRKWSDQEMRAALEGARVRILEVREETGSEQTGGYAIEAVWE